MKRTVILMAAVASMMIFGACKSSKVTPQEMGNKRLTTPCFNESRDSKEYFGGIGVDENLNRQNARLDALKAAKQMIRAKIGGQIKGLSEDWSKYVRGDARQSKSQSEVEDHATQVLEYLLDHAEQTCMEEYQTPSGSYEVHIAIRISKTDLIDKTAESLSKNQELEIEFNREQFRKFAEEYLKNLEEKQNR